MRDIAATCETSLQHATHRCNMRDIAAACDTSLQRCGDLVHLLKADRARLVDLTPLDRRAGFEARELQRHSGNVALCRVWHGTV
jgi:hypothetical protein